MQDIRYLTIRLLLRIVMVNIVVCSQEQLYTVYGEYCKSEHLVISIKSTKYPAKWPILLPNDLCLGWLKMSFDDIDKPDNIYQCMTVNHALTIKYFVLSYSDSEKPITIITHCEGGISRGPAIGLSLNLKYNWSLSILTNDAITPNTLVFDTLSSVL